MCVRRARSSPSDGGTAAANGVGGSPYPEGVPSVPTFSDATIGRLVGQQSLARGFVYARTGRVLELNVDEDGALEGLVQGSDPEPYEVSVELDPTARRLEWTCCTCPVGQDCKHVAAVLIASRREGSVPTEAGAQPSSEWERSLDSLLGAPVAGHPTASVGLALRIEATTPDPNSPLELRCRPVRPGRTGKWVQQGVSWNDLSYAWRADFDPAQRSSLTQLQQLGRSTDPYAYYGRVDWLTLVHSPRLLWTALTQLVESGVELVAGSKGPGVVTLSEVSAELTMDVRQIAPGGGLRMGPRLSLAGQEPTARRVGFLGTPAHGVVLEFVEPAGSRLVLAPLSRPADAATQDWLQHRRRAVDIPAADRDRFLAEFAPRLRRSVALTSTDPSVTFPEPSPPAPALALRHGEPGQLELFWSVVYRVGERLVRVDPWKPGDETGLRDTVAERQLLSDLRASAGAWSVRLGLEPPAVHPIRQLIGIDAAVFCADVVPALQAAGVEVTQTGEQRDYRRSDSVPEIALSVAEFDDRSDWFDLSVSVTLDGETVPFDLLFAALARGEDDLILPSGTYFSLNRPELARLAELIGEARLLQDRERDGLRINVRQPSLWEELVGCGVVAEQASRWRTTVEALAGLESPPPVDPPAGLTAELRPYQQQGYAWLHQLWSAGVGGILADDMGLGKTLQALALICAVHEEEPPDTDPFLVVAPTSVVSNWAAEAARFTPGLRVVAIEATERKRGVGLDAVAAEADVVITSYTLLRIDAERYQAQAWRGLILDEAQFVKNHQAKTYGAIRRLGVGFTIAMTGTPLENSLMDLWSMLSLSAPGMFPSPQKFTEYYRIPIERGEAPERLAVLQRRIRPVMLRRTKDVVAAELPAKQEQVLEVDLHDRHARLYSTYLQRERQKVLRLIEDMDENRFTILRSLTVLRQLSLEAALVDEKHDGVPSAKIDLLADMLPELVAEGHRALVFSQFTRFLRRIGDRLNGAGVRYSYLDGRTRNRAKVIEDFRSGNNGAFLISLKAGGFGLNLTEADYCFVCDPWWNPATEAQAVDRAHRIGQTRPVMVYRLVSKDTIEEKVMALKARKAALFASVMEADGIPSGALTSDDIRDLLVS